MVLKQTVQDLDSNASDDVARVLKFRRLSLITGRELSKAVSLYSKLGFVPASQGRYSNSPNSIAMTYDIPVCCHGEACDTN